jgi:predicted outer membrane protein
MNKLSFKKFIIILFILTVVVSSGNSQIFNKNASRKAEKSLFGKSLSKKKAPKVQEPRSVTKAKKKQEAKKRKLDKDYAKSVKRSQKRTIDIQTPEVQERMKQDKKNTAARDKEKKKQIRSSTKKAGKKYK